MKVKKTFAAGSIGIALVSVLGLALYIIAKEKIEVKEV